ncbi:hypothetical protein KR200_006873 [Drosophila serrata]|nr:hypothetical protein KR200_006873 [Drosophila serrata]
MADREDSRKDASAEKNAATRFGLEDHEANQQDARVTTLRSDHERRSLMMPADGRRYNKSTSRIMSVNDAWSIPRSPEEERESKAQNDSDRKASDNNDTLVLNKSTSKVHEAEVPSSVRAYDADSSETDAERKSSFTPVVTPASFPMVVPKLGITPEGLSDTDGDYKMQPPKERPEDLPMPPPIMMPITPCESKALTAVGSGEDVQSSLSKLTNTDVTFNPSKKFATKGTNTSGTMIAESDSEDEDTFLPESFSASDLKSLFLLACREVKSAGEIARAHDEEKQQDKGREEPDPESRTESLVESTFINAISSRFPDHIFITGERIVNSESGIVDLTDKPTWIIDPIDGAMNYAHHFPYYCMSVAYLVDRQTEFGIIYNPPMKNMYTAQRDKGAKLNGKGITATAQKDLSSALVLQEFGSGANEPQGRMGMENAQRLAKVAHAMRSIGSPVMGLAMVASGVADAYFNFGLHIWHMAAGVLLVTEAGGAVIDPAGGELDIMSRRCLVASTDQLAQDIAGRLEQSYPSPRDDEPCKPEMQDFTSQTDFPDTESSEAETTAPNH